MNSQEFTTNALRTESKPGHIMVNLAALVLFLQLGIRSSALLDLIKKAMFYSKPVDLAKYSDHMQSLAYIMEQITLCMTNGRLYENPGVAIPEANIHVPNLRIAHGAIGMFTESGELLEALMLQILSGELDLVNVAEETGDSDWYKAIIHDETGISEEQVRERVIAKLKARYGDKFSNEAATTRNLTAERQVLEGKDVGDVGDVVGDLIGKQE